jgi:hypothetical protein
VVATVPRVPQLMGTRLGWKRVKSSGFCRWQG